MSAARLPVFAVSGRQRQGALSRPRLAVSFPERPRISTLVAAHSLQLSTPTGVNLGSRWENLFSLDNALCVCLRYGSFMRPVANVERTHATSSLLDILDRVLDKGIVIDAWLRFSLMGIELVTVEARVVVASITTYLGYAEALAELKPAVVPPNGGDPVKRSRAVALQPVKSFVVHPLGGNGNPRRNAVTGGENGSSTGSALVGRRSRVVA